MPRPRLTIEQMFDRRVQVEPNSACWLWTGAHLPNGYGGIEKKVYGQRLAHRYFYVARRGPVPEGAQLDHLCRVRSCVNPDHLQPVTARENQMRSEFTIAYMNAAKTHCPSGHLYDRHYPRYRECGVCRNDRKRAVRAMRRA